MTVVYSYVISPTYATKWDHQRWITNGPSGPGFFLTKLKALKTVSLTLLLMYSNQRCRNILAFSSQRRLTQNSDYFPLSTRSTGGSIFSIIIFFVVTTSFWKGHNFPFVVQCKCFHDNLQKPVEPPLGILTHHTQQLYVTQSPVFLE